tara:strand:- start:25 stop:315 length:291 start_codon:yes stop_codon:yes gene_type:complete
MTSSVDEYISLWEELASGVSEITGLEPDSFDPCICLKTNMPNYPFCYFSPDQASDMIKRWLNKDAGRREPFIDAATKNCREEYDEEVDLYKTYGGD